MMLLIFKYAVIFSYHHPMRPYCLLPCCLIGGFATAMLPDQTRPTIGFAICQDCRVWVENCTERLVAVVGPWLSGTIRIQDMEEGGKVSTKMQIVRHVSHHFPPEPTHFRTHSVRFLQLQS